MSTHQVQVGARLHPKVHEELRVFLARHHMTFQAFVELAVAEAIQPNRERLDRPGARVPAAAVPIDPDA